MAKLGESGYDGVAICDESRQLNMSLHKGELIMSAYCRNHQLHASEICAFMPQTERDLPLLIGSFLVTKL